MSRRLDPLCTVVYCTADDLLPESPGNARRRVTDAEVVTLCVAQAIMGIPSERRFLKVARKRLAHWFGSVRDSVYCMMEMERHATILTDINKDNTTEEARELTAA